MRFNFSSSSSGVFFGFDLTRSVKARLGLDSPCVSPPLLASNQPRTSTASLPSRVNPTVQDNADLFLRTRNNITAILNSMSGMPGIMSQMPPLPVTINEDLVTTILPNTSQAFMFNSPSSITVKQEPRC